jgi:hypothetical protein
MSHHVNGKAGSSGGSGVIGVAAALLRRRTVAQLLLDGTSRLALRLQLGGTARRLRLRRAQLLVPLIAQRPDPALLRLQLRPPPRLCPRRRLRPLRRRLRRRVCLPALLLQRALLCLALAPRRVGELLRHGALLQPCIQLPQEVPATHAPASEA